MQEKKREEKTVDNLLKNRVDSQKEIERANRRGKKKAKKKGQPATVIYSTNGKIKKRPVAAWKKAIAVTGGVIGALAAFIYLPPMFIRQSGISNPYSIAPDQTAIKAYQTFLKDSPDLDFDQDGLPNKDEDEHGTDVWKIDTDGDGISDYAELYITQTSPTVPTSDLVTQTMKKDKKTGDTLATPYKIDDIIFWPDDYRSKAYGAVVRTTIGYRFWNYSGWVRFPQDLYAYSYADGVTTPLPYNEGARAWHISSSDEVRLYPVQLQFVNRLRLFGNDLYLEDGGAGSFLSKILPPSGGFVSCRRIAEIDTEPDTGKPATAPIVSPYINHDDYARLGQNSSSLKDLSYVYKSIDAGECIAVSLYSGDVGETIGIVYGYEPDGDLLVADESLQPAGEIHIIERAKRMMDKNGEIGQISWYEFYGLGYDSMQNGDRISFFASTRDRAADEETAPSES